MIARLEFKRLAEAEIAEAFAWYDQDGIGKGAAFLAELERVERFIRLNPRLYPKVEGDIHRANLRRFPYALFYVVDGDTISVLSCLHQHRDPLIGGP
ncbi:MAG TPA: type II toxin-antitoxin system RelE/ParE family toxin [Aquabacterium sp.]|nr:type II toxin-antitoxin system RelE/ParE family toxin [Aquabacterium sp.]HQC95749.1 type II toxin-antitoxin system RelE/ParE family toxin [Aquabacterium sp.]